MTPFVFFVGLTAAAAAALAARHLFLSYLGKAWPDRLPEDSPDQRDDQHFAESSLRRIGALVSVSQMREREIRKALAQAGLDMDVFTWVGVEIISICTCVATGIVATIALNPPSVLKLLIVALALFLGYALPRLIVSAKKRQRVRKITASLPAALELLSTTVHAGYPLERGIRLIGQKTQGDLALEFRRVDREINYLNMPLDKALERLKERCDTPSMTYFVNAVIQSYKQGTSIARTLETQAKAARSQYYSEVLVKINQLPSKMVPVIFIVFFPIIIVLSVAPVLYNTFVQFSNLM